MKKEQIEKLLEILNLNCDYCKFNKWACHRKIRNGYDEVEGYESNDITFCSRFVDEEEL